MAFLWPRLFLIREYLIPKYPSLSLIAPRAHWTNKGFKYWPALEIRTDFFLLALSLFAQQVSCLSDSNCFISTPISEIIRIADKVLIPGSWVMCMNRSNIGAARFIISISQLLIWTCNSSIWVIDSFILNLWSVSILQCLMESRILSLFLHDPWIHFKIFSSSMISDSSTSFMIACADFPNGSENTEPIPILETVIQFWYRLRSEERIPTNL